MPSRCGSHRITRAGRTRTPARSSGSFGAARRSGGCDAERANVLCALHDVQVREHVDVRVAFDDHLALPILLDPAHPRLGCPVAHEPRDGDVPHVGLEDLLRARLVPEPPGLTARVTPGLDLAAARAVHPRPPSAGRLL